MNGKIDFASRLKKAGGMHIVAKMPYARNTWALVRDAGFKFGDGSLGGVTVYQKLFVLESLQLDNKELERAQKGYDSENSSEFYDDSTAWYDDPDHNGMFDDDPQSDEEAAKQEAKFIDADLQAGINEKIATIREQEGSDYNIESELDEVMASRQRMVDELIHNKEKQKEYRKAIHSSDNKVQSGDDAKEQQALAKKALENTMNALRGDYM